MMYLCYGRLTVFFILKHKKIYIFKRFIKNAQKMSLLSDIMYAILVPDLRKK